MEVAWGKMLVLVLMMCRRDCRDSTEQSSSTGNVAKKHSGVTVNSVN